MVSSSLVGRQFIGAGSRIALGHGREHVRLAHGPGVDLHAGDGAAEVARVAGLPDEDLRDWQERGEGGGDGHRAVLGSVQPERILLHG